jgi:hypothetical protein
MLRNPVDMLYAYHSQLHWGGYEDISDFEEALNAEPERLCDKRIPRCAMMPNSLYYRDVASFSAQVKRYLDVFGQDRVHVILFDDFKQDLSFAYRQTLDFLEVNHIELKNYKVVNPNKVARFRWYAEMIQRPPAPIRLALKLIPDRQRYWLLGKLSRLNTKLPIRPPMPPELRRRLIEEFRGEIESLEQLLKCDLTKWK